MNSDDNYDLVVVGGGLAGLSAAALLARKKYKVLVIEKENYPRHKVCGEYISMESRPFLERLGIRVNDMRLPLIHKLQVTDGKGNELNIGLPQGGFGISRYSLDACLADAAQQSGATLLTRTRVDDVAYENDQFRVTTANGTFTAIAVCGAWGKRSNLDVKWHRPFIAEKNKALNNYIGVKYHIRYTWPRDCVGLHNFDSGYCGISPVEDHKSCLCYLTNAANLQQCDNDIKQMERDILWKNPVLRNIFSKAEFLYQAPLAISQISFQHKEQVSNHVLMAGDASGMITPLCGNGMSMAFHSAKIVSDFIAGFLSGDTSRAEMERGYSAAWKKTFSRRLSLGRFVQGNFGKGGSTSFLLKTFYRVPFLQKFLIEGTSGKTF
jgi:menaquinone-9 beta-reductase